MQANCPGYDSRDQLSIGNSCQLDSPNSLRVARGNVSDQLKRQACLATATNTGECQQTGVGLRQDAMRDIQILLSADERRARLWHPGNRPGLLHLLLPRLVIVSDARPGQPAREDALNYPSKR